MAQAPAYSPGSSTRGSGLSTRGSDLSTRVSGLSTRGSGLSTRGSGLSTRGSGLSTRGSGLASRGATSSTLSTLSPLSPLSPLSTQSPLSAQNWNTSNQSLGRGSGLAQRGTSRGRGVSSAVASTSENLFSTVRLPITQEQPPELISILPPLPFEVERYANDDIGTCDLTYGTRPCTNEEILRYTETVHLLHLDGDITVAQDHIFPYGAKIRGHRAMQVIKNMGKKGVVASGTNYGMGQVALAAACNFYGLQCKIFLTGSTDTEMSIKAKVLGADIVMNNFRLREAKDASVLFARSSNDTYYWMEPGLADPIFMNALTENLKFIKSKYNLKPTEIWVAGGTGTFATCLCSAYPEVTVHIVQVGLPIWEDLLKNKNYKLHIYSKGNFYADYPGIVPYESLSNYDAKVWDFRSQMAPGALIWNIY